MISDYLTSLLSNYVFLPAALLCYMPMRNRLRYSPRGTFIRVAPLLVAVIAVTSFIEAYYSLSYNASLPFWGIVAFIVYYLTLNVPFYKSVSVYIAVYAFISFFSNFSNAYDAALYPLSSPDNFSTTAGLFQAVLITVAVAIVLNPVYKYGSRIIDELDIPRVWYMTLPVSITFLGYNLIHVPDQYADLYVGSGFAIYILSLVLLLTLLCILCVHFYFVVSDILEASADRERSRILEMQENVYNTQQRYLEDTARVRHDFRHTIGILEELSRAGDITGIRHYLDKYTAQQPENDIIYFCKNTAVNAMLNYYAGMWNEAAINVTYEIYLPGTTPVSDVDLCSVLGNILDNAIRACREIPEIERFIDILVRAAEDGRLYIVVTNSFSGRTKIKDGRYVSTIGHGHGLGLRSIASIAAKYGGSARFEHDGTEFHTDVILVK